MNSCHNSPTFPKESLPYTDIESMWWKQCRSFIQQGCQALVFRSLGFIFYLVSVSSGSTVKML